MICDKCGKQIEDGSKFCTYCGNPIIKIQTSNKNRCLNCGFDNDLETKFCVKCGKRITINTNLSNETEYSYNQVCNQFVNANNIKDYRKCISLFEGLGDYKDSNEKIEACKKRIEELTELENQKKQKMVKRGKIGAIAAVIVIVLALFTVKFIVPNVSKMISYHKATSYMENGDYDKAVSTFESLGTYKDSQDQMLESEYLLANSDVEEEKYEEAIEIYQSIKDYKDSSDLFILTSYNYAKTLMESKDYDNALTYIQKCNSYSDSKDLEKECNYYLAVDYMNKANYSAAVRHFNNCKEYLDAADLKEKAYYDWGCQLINQGDYQEAIKKFLCSSYSGTGQKILEAKYLYCASNKDRTSSIVYDYLQELISANYSGAQSLYDSLYQWSVTPLCVNTSEDDTISNYSSISKYNTWYFHFKVSGGPPDGSMSLTYIIYWPDGEVSNKPFSGSFSDEDFGSVSGWWNSPAYATSGNVTVKIYGNGSELASYTFYFG